MSLSLNHFEDRHTPALFAAAGVVYTDTGAFQPFAGYTGPLDVSLAGDVDGNGHPDIVIGAGEGGGPRVSVIDGVTRKTLANFFAFEPTFRGGVSVAVDGTNGELLVGAGRGGAPVVATYDLASFREIDRRYYGPESDRGGVSVDADSAPRGTASLTVGSGRWPVWVSLPGRSDAETVAVVRGLAEVFGPVLDVIRFTSVQPSDYPSNYLTASTADLGYFPIPVTGLATSVITNRQPDSFLRQEVFADENLPVEQIVAVFAHEIGHFFGLAHTEDIRNVMHAPTVVGATFNAGQFAVIRGAITPTRP
jgi:hypothetical protein